MKKIQEIVLRKKKWHLSELSIFQSIGICAGFALLLVHLAFPVIVIVLNKILEE